MEKVEHMQEKIDVVIPWVDGNDPLWLKQKNQYYTGKEKSVHAFNYQDWGLLKYWFRGIEKYMPWVRYVFFVTWGHIPEWLDTTNPKLKIVKHADYIPQKYLPTFSSHVIELNLHRIKGLSEHFIYFNDDTYVIRPCTSEIFFKNGMPMDSAIINPIAPANTTCISFLQLTTVAVINQNFKKRRVVKKNLRKWYNLKYKRLLPLNFLFIPWNRFPGLLEKHIPTSFLKSTYKEVWEKEYELLNQTCMHKFRDFKTDVNQWVIKEWQIAKGTFEPRDINVGKLLNICNIDDAICAAKCIEQQKYSVLCINDHIEGEFEKEAKVIQDSFEKILPDKSKFEK